MELVMDKYYQKKNWPTCALSHWNLLIHLHCLTLQLQQEGKERFTIRHAKIKELQSKLIKSLQNQQKNLFHLLLFFHAQKLDVSNCFAVFWFRTAFTMWNPQVLVSKIFLRHHQTALERDVWKNCWTPCSSFSIYRIFSYCWRGVLQHGLGFEAWEKELYIRL